MLASFLALKTPISTLLRHRTADMAAIASRLLQRCLGPKLARNLDSLLEIANAGTLALRQYRWRGLLRPLIYSKLGKIFFIGAACGRKRPFLQKRRHPHGMSAAIIPTARFS